MRQFYVSLLRNVISFSPISLSQCPAQEIYSLTIVRIYDSFNAAMNYTTNDYAFLINLDNLAQALPEGHPTRTRIQNILQQTQKLEDMIRRLNEERHARLVRDRVILPDGSPNPDFCAD